MTIISPVNRCIYIYIYNATITTKMIKNRKHQLFTGIRVFMMKRAEILENQTNCILITIQWIDMRNMEK